MTVGVSPFSPLKPFQLYNKCVWFMGTLSRILCPKTGTSWNSWRLVKNLSWIKGLQVLTGVGVEHLDGGLYRGAWTALFSATPTERSCFVLLSPRNSDFPYGNTQPWVCREVAYEKAWFSQSLKNFCLWKNEVNDCIPVLNVGIFKNGFLKNCFCIRGVTKSQGSWKCTFCMWHSYETQLGLHLSVWGPRPALSTWFQVAWDVQDSLYSKISWQICEVQSSYQAGC